MSMIKVGDLVIGNDNLFGEVIKVNKKTAVIKIQDIGQDGVTESEAEVRRPLHELQVAQLPKVEEQYKENTATFSYTAQMKEKINDMAKTMIHLIQANSRTSAEAQVAVTTFRQQVFQAIKKEEQVPFHTTLEDSKVAQVDALTDTLYFIIGSFVELGVTPERDDVNDLSTERYPNEHRLFHQVSEFHATGGHPVAHKPTSLTMKRLTDRLGYTVEELVEFIHSVSHSQEEFQALTAELVDVILQEAISVLKSRDIKDTVVELFNYLHSDILDLFEIIEMPSAVFGDIVHQANMTKFYLDEEGNYYAKIRESDGKIMKSPDFRPPEEDIKAKVKEILEAQ